MFKDALNSCDIFGFVPSFQINKNKSFTSVYGIIMSILIYGLVIYSIWVFGKDIIIREKPNMIVSEYNDPDPLRIDLNKNKFSIAMGLQFPNYTLYIDESIYTISAEHIVINRNNNVTAENEITQIEMAPCSQINITLIPSYYSKLDLGNLYCFKNADDNVYLQGDFGREKWAHIEIYLHPCKNTSLNNKCKTQEEISEALNGGYFGTFTSDMSIDPTNYENPGSYYGRNIWTTFSLKAFREYWWYFSTIEVESDSGWLMEELDKKKYYEIKSTTEVWDYRDTSDSFFKFGLRCSLSRQVFNRSYIKVQTIAANLGGLLKLSMIIGQIIVSYFAKLKYKEYLVDTFYHINNTGKNQNVNARNVIIQQHESHYHKYILYVI